MSYPLWGARQHRPNSSSVVSVPAGIRRVGVVAPAAVGVRAVVVAEMQVFVKMEVGEEQVALEQDQHQ